MIAIPCALLLAGAARLSVPMVPVPTTLQTLAVCLVALVLGARVALLTACLYLAAAWCGLPVLSDGSSFQPGGLLAAKTAGYVVGFLPAGWLLGRIADRPGATSPPLALGGCIMAHAVILLFGSCWLGAHVGAAVAWEQGVLPFLLGGFAKSAVAAWLAAALSPGARR